MLDIWDNPVFRREVRSRLRLRRSATKGMVWTAGTIAVLIAYFYGRGLLMVMHGTMPAACELWSMLVYGLLFFVVLLAPALSATAITQEREQKTWELMNVTRLTPEQVILGKWFARLLPLAALILFVLPLLLVTGVKAQVPPILTIAVLVFLTMTAALFGLLGLVCSFRSRRSTIATVTALSLSALLCFGTAAMNMLFQGTGSDTIFIWLNPFYALLDWASLFSPERIGALGGSPEGSVGAGVVYTLAALIAIPQCLTYMFTRYGEDIEDR